MKHHLLRFSCLLLLPLSAIAQGDLAPRGAPAPTMRTLDQVEPRTPIGETSTPGDANNHHIITEPGSYYLTGNLAASRQNAIRIIASGVTLDLNGFQISRQSGTGGAGITVDAANCTVKNGTVSGFASGVTATAVAKSGSYLNIKASNCTTSGLDGGRSWRMENCAVTEITGDGIAAGEGSTLLNCTATGCSKADGRAIQAGSGSTFINCTAATNTVAYGIYAFGASTLVNCTAQANTSDRPFSGGISAGPFSTVSGCTALLNTSTHGSANGDTGAGIVAGEGAVVKDCSVGLNKGDGINAENSVIISGNACVGNGLLAGSGAGIRITGNNARVQNNNIASNDVGIRSEGTGTLIEGNHVRNHPGPGIQVTTANGKNVIIRNVAGDNVNSYTNIAAGNQVGPIDSNFTSTSPFANLQN